MIATGEPGQAQRLVVIRAACVACLVLALGMLASCHRAPTEQQIHDAIEAAGAAARGNDASSVLDVLSEDFTGNEGDLDPRGLRRLLALRALRQAKTSILIGPITFERKGDRMIARFNLVLAGGRRGDLLPGRSSVYAMTTAWRREGNAWKCYNAEWTSATRQ